MSYDDMKIFNDIATYQKDINITNNTIYEYIKNNNDNNLIEENIILIETNEEDNSQIFEIKRGLVDAFIGFTSEKHIIWCDILDDNYNIKRKIIPEIIFDDIVVQQSDNIFVDILQNNINYINKKIYKLNFIQKCPYTQLIIKVYYAKNEILSHDGNNQIKQCGFFCKDINLRKFFNFHFE
jgi:hypothetical protein